MTGPIPIPAGARVVTDRAELVELYTDDVRLHIYALADLDEPFWSASTWWRRGDAAVGLVGLPARPTGDEPGWAGGHVVYAVSSRAPTETLVLLSAVAGAIPAGTLLTGPVGLHAALGERPVAWSRTYHRYWLPPGVDLPAPSPAVIAVGPGDEGRLAALYGVEPGAAFFTPSMLTTGTFAGVEHDGVLVAAAGTHVVAGRGGVAAAAIGAVFTHPDHRGRGLGRDVTVAVARRLRDRGRVIGLNCAEANEPAQRIYRQLGFEPLLRYEEALLGPG